MKSKSNHYKSLKVLITGATGFVGSHLADKLIAKNYEVYCLKRKSSSLRWLEGKSVKYVEGDLFSNETLEKTISEMDYVFHVAGLVKAKTRDEYYRGNYESTKNLLEITYKVNSGLKKFVFISSLAATGPALNEDYVDEKTIPHPITTYGKSKLKAEEEVMSYRDKLNISIIAPPAVFGPRDTEILIYFKTFYKGLDSLIGMKPKFLSLVYVEDLADAIILAAESDKSTSQKYFAGMDGMYSYDQLGSVTSKLLGKKALKIKIPHAVVYTVGFIAELFSKFSSKPATLNIEKCKDLTQDRWTCSNEKIKSDLNFLPKYNLETGFKKTIDWYKEMKWI